MKNFNIKTKKNKKVSNNIKRKCITDGDEFIE